MAQKGSKGSRREQQKREKPARPACVDPASDQYGRHRWVEWGSDQRFKRRRWCGCVEASHISDEARYGERRIPERPSAHHHTFEPSLLDRRYERCACGASRKAGKVGAA